jgi:pimeloyl-ACP methyl ester carboxylesterase
MSDPGKQTVVLVHGAFADSSSWNDVIEPLTRAGHSVIAAANPLRGLQGDAAYVRSVLESIDGPIVVAGHSYTAEPS